ncbi:hypothetical protein MAIT1_05102 [Magnetofaba australis IT-1]|uniref:Uncharacterized protein n=2 Tax=Magnetofaba TaxID=1472292 RepID=A0A1Y2KBR9_9PROT|nr:hypothetical protein MAIT1_05102 [Magnetofaba australis IT-1]
METLLQYGARVDMAMPILEEWDEGVDGFYPIHMAASSKKMAQSAQAIQILVDAGADINQERVKFHGTPLTIAIDIGNIHAVRKLWALAKIQNKKLRAGGTLKFSKRGENPEMAILGSGSV